ncbi:hypothetical protein SCUCBS95973_003687 [Sporothrix curviconia]|uniref:Uncharacterized protein n=1 Tax=Sporothrix curviconia TaxID=1260050 RepID=A0ABP0BIL9_9PEZI
MATPFSKDIKSDPSPPPSSSSSPTPKHAEQRTPPAPLVLSAMAVSVDTSAARLAAPTGRDASTPRMLTPPPQSARTELASRIGDFALSSPVAERNRGKTLRTGPVFSAQNRAILLSGLPQSPDSHEGASQPQSPSRDGVTQQLQQRRNLTPLVTVHSSPAHVHQQQQYSPQYYGYPRSAVGVSPNAPPSSPLPSPRIYSQVVRVKAVPFGHRPRRDSATDTRSAQATRTAGNSTNDGKAKDVATPVAAGIKRDAGLTPPPEGQLQVSAYIISHAADSHDKVTRTITHLKRDFDLQALLDAVPRLPSEASADVRRYRSSVSILASPVVGAAPSPVFPPRTPLSARPPTSANERGGPPGPPPPTPITAPVVNYVAGMKRPAADHSSATPASPHSNLRRKAAKHGRQPSQQELPPTDQVLSDGSVLIPILPHPSLGGLPALAAVILSRFAKAGDVIELPLPHPGAWGQTISYVYHSRGELTDHVRENIQYLGGKPE